MNIVQEFDTLLDWSIIEDHLSTFIPAAGGFTNAKRGSISLATGDTVFIKMGIDEPTKLWANKEIEIYKILTAHNFEYIPKLLAVNEDLSGFALESLSPNDGWEWETEWSKERLAKTLEAMDELASLDIDDIPRRLLNINMMNEQRNPWLVFMHDSSKHALLQSKLGKINKNDLAEDIASNVIRKGTFNFDFSKDSLVHNDVRRDNCAWNQRTSQVKLIDWNWLQVGDRRIDVNAVLVNAYKAGLELADGFSHRLDKSALLWLAGYWFRASVDSLNENASEAIKLRDYQLESAVSAYMLASTL